MGSNERENVSTSVNSWVSIASPFRVPFEKQLKFLRRESISRILLPALVGLAPFPRSRKLGRLSHNLHRGSFPGGITMR